MARAWTDGGVHASMHNSTHPMDAESLQALKTQDMAYLYLKRAVDRHRAEKLTRGLPFVDVAESNRHTVVAGAAADL